MKRILIIDNDADFEAGVRQQLEAWQLTVASAAEGQAGLDAAKEDPPDAILLAAELPDMSGYSTCNKIKRSKKLKQVPVMIVSTGETPETFQQHQEHKHRAEHYKLKDGDPAAISADLAGLLGLDPAAPGAAAEQADDPFAGDEDDLDSAFDGLTAQPAEQPAEASEEELESIEELEPLDLDEAVDESQMPTDPPPTESPAPTPSPTPSPGATPGQPPETTAAKAGAKAGMSWNRSSIRSPPRPTRRPSRRSRRPDPTAHHPRRRARSRWTTTSSASTAS